MVTYMTVQKAENGYVVVSAEKVLVCATINDVFKQLLLGLENRGETLTGDKVAIETVALPSPASIVQ
jgi:hypothetical protein